MRRISAHPDNALDASHWNRNACVPKISAAEPLEGSGRQPAALGDQGEQGPFLRARPGECGELAQVLVGDAALLGQEGAQLGQVRLQHQSGGFLLGRWPGVQGVDELGDGGLGTVQQSCGLARRHEELGPIRCGARTSPRGTRCSMPPPTAIPTLGGMMYTWFGSMR